MRVYGALRFSQIWNHHLHNLALSRKLVGVQRPRVNVECDPTVRVSQEFLFLYGLHIYSIPLQVPFKIVPKE
jgi:hypothetical protein